jgi:MFS family permease
LNSAIAVFTNRILLGGVTALVMAGSTVLISQWYFGKERLIMIAKQGMAIELGGVIFLFLGGILAAQYWALPLSLYLIAWLFLAMLLIFVPRQHPIEVETEKDDEHKALSKSLSLKSVYIIATCSMLIFFIAYVLLPSSMHKQNYNEEEVGFLLAFISLVAVITAHFMPKITRLIGERKTLTCAFISYCLSYICFLQTGTPILVIGAIFSGIGFGFSIPLLNHMTVELSNTNVRGRNLSYFTMAVFSGQFLTSFIGYIPGGTSSVFRGCVALCVVISVTLFFKYLNSQKKKHKNKYQGA